MDFPQTFCKKISKNINWIATWGCLAFVYIWCCYIDADVASQVEIVSDALDAGKIDEKDGVLAEPFIEWLTGRKVKVTKVDIKDIKKIKKRTPVLYTYNGQPHWVGVENGQIKYNSIMNSVCVTKGKPVSMRVIEIVKGVK